MLRLAGEHLTSFQQSRGFLNRHVIPFKSNRHEGDALCDQQPVSPSPRRNKSCVSNLRDGIVLPYWTFRAHLYCATYSTRFSFARVRMVQSLPIRHSGLKSPSKLILTYLSYRQSGRFVAWLIPDSSVRPPWLASLGKGFKP